MLNSGYTCTIHRSLDDKRMLDHLHQIESNANRIQPFNTLWWIRHSFSTDTNCTPLIVIYYEGETPSAFAVFKHNHARRALLMPDNEMRDVFDIVGGADCSEAAAAICDALPWKEIDEIDLRKIPASSPLIEKLRSAASQHGRFVHVHFLNITPSMPLHDTNGSIFPSYRSIMRGKTSKQLRKNLEKAGAVDFRVASTPDDVPSLLRELSFLHQMRWNNTPFPSPLSSMTTFKALADKCSAALRHGNLHLSLLFLDSKPIAGALGYLINGTYYYHIVAYNPLYRKLSPGRALMTYLLDDLLARKNVQTFNFLAGAEAYKLTHSTAREELYHFFATKKPIQWLRMRLVGRIDIAIRSRPRLLNFSKLIKHRYLALRYKAIIFHRGNRALVGYYGVGQTVTKACTALVEKLFEHRSMIVMALDVKDASPKAEASPKEYFVTKADLRCFNHLLTQKYSFLKPDELDSFFSRSFNGDTLWVLRNKKKIISSVWLQIAKSYSPAELYHEHRLCTSDPGEAVLLDAWTDARYRGQGFYRRLLSEALAGAEKSCTIDRIYCVVDKSNKGSIIAHKNFGFTETEILGVVRLFSKTIHTYRKPDRSKAAA
ncbi:MAG: GNAT family N-acetyltransferase [Chitinivibrionales bacterium]|nr:GNAT family N-acetyltransferase [Chitinivibrionales bacterium]MBD3357860.1 GNAT family N-acetyltransferase [Chitinivibrionales bacterium]